MFPKKIDFSWGGTIYAALRVACMDRGTWKFIEKEAAEFGYNDEGSE